MRANIGDVNADKFQKMSWYKHLPVSLNICRFIFVKSFSLSYTSQFLPSFDWALISLKFT